MFRVDDQLVRHILLRGIPHQSLVMPSLKHQNNYQIYNKITQNSWFQSMLQTYIQLTFFILFICIHCVSIDCHLIYDLHISYCVSI